jgi:hypothetical protein
LSVELVFIAMEGEYQSVQLPRLAKASILPRRNARVTWPIPVEASACKAGVTVCVQVRLLRFAQSTGKILKLAKHVQAVVAPPPIGRVFTSTCATYTINDQ